MSNYKVENVEIRKQKSGGNYLILTLCGRLVSFFEEEDISVNINLGDVVSCDVTLSNNFLNGHQLQVVPETADIKIETSIKIVDRIKRTKNEPINKKSSTRRDSKDDTFLRAGGRTYYFNIKPTSRGDPYLIITEQRGNNRARIYVFKDDAHAFEEKMLEALRKVKK